MQDVKLESGVTAAWKDWIRMSQDSDDRGYTVVLATRWTVDSRQSSYQETTGAV